VWLIPLVSYPNNNALEQDSHNLLRPNYDCCEEYVLAQPDKENLGEVHHKTVVGSNVQHQETLVKAHEMATASQNNATL
jgi:flagellar basal body rod protein FlgG